MPFPPTIKRVLSYAVWALLDAFILASAVTVIFASKTGSNIFVIQSAPEINVQLLLGSAAVITGVFFLLFFFRRRVFRWITPLCITAFAVGVSLTSLYSVPAYFSLAMCGAAVTSALMIKDIFPDTEVKLLKGKWLYIFLAVLAAAATAQAALTSIARHICYSSSTFDLGIFAQMYEYMSYDLTLNTTLERNVLMSHFAVHFSPVYYLLLPFYLLFPSVEFLLAAQAAVCFSGIIPLLLLCRHWRYSESVTLGLGMVFLLFPAFTGGLSYDFHENAFLVPFLLWALYFLEKNSTAGIAVSSLLILCVKEDAGLYLIFMGLYALFNKKVKRLNAVMLFGVGVSGFIAVTSLIDVIGEGIKVSRYSNFLTDGQDSLTDVVINVIKNPAFFLNTLLSRDKLLFALQMLVPLMFLPVRTRKLQDWLLIAPLILVNLATDYTYQSDIHYQYVFGSGVLLVFLCAKNLRYCKEKTRTVTAAAMAALIILTGAMSGRYQYIERTRIYSDSISATNASLAQIPEDAVVFSTTYFTPHLYRCKELYMYPPIYEIDEKIVPDYVVLDNRGVLKEYDELLEQWTEQGYVVIRNEGYATVLAAEN